MNKCLTCSINTNNSKFCSRSCAATYNNKVVIKRLRTKKCDLCNILIQSKFKYCTECYKSSVLNLNTPIGILKNARTRIRTHARRIAKDAGLLDKCKICKYTFRVDCCHIKPVAKFNEHTKLGIVNSLDNLIGLCPNHHIEFDSGILNIGFVA
jgi:hypothetical protein